MAITAFTSGAIIDATAIGKTVLTASSEGVAADAIGLGSTDSPTFADGTYTGTLNAEQGVVVNSGRYVGLGFSDTKLSFAATSVIVQVGTTAVSKATTTQMRYYKNIIPNTNNLGSCGLDGFRWSAGFFTDGSFSGNLNTEVGGSYKLYNLGDESAADTEYLEISATANEYFISPKETGTGARRDLFVAGSYAATRSHLEFQNNGNLRIAYGSTANVLVGGGYVQVGTNLWPTTDNAVTCGKAANRWSTVYGVDGSFSGTLDTEVGGSNRIFNLGSDADVAAGNTEYLETSWDTNAATISTKNTGAGVKRNLHLGDSAVPKTRIAGARVEILDGLLFAAVFDSGSSTFYGSGIRPISDGVQECGFSSARWGNVHSVDGDFSGDVVMAANVDFTGLPTSDPSVSGRLWNDSGTVKISGGTPPPP